MTAMITEIEQELFKEFDLAGACEVCENKEPEWLVVSRCCGVDLKVCDPCAEALKIEIAWHGLDKLRCAVCEVLGAPLEFLPIGA